MNSANQSLALSQGQISKAFLQAAGRRLKEECSKSYPNGICFGEVAVTQGYKLKCKNVYHVALPTWQTPFVNPQQVGAWNFFQIDKTYGQVDIADMKGQIVINYD